MLTVVQSIGLKVIVVVAKRLVSRGLYQRLGVLVADAAHLIRGPGTGVEKKAWVLARLADEAGWVREEIRTAPSWLVSMIVDIAVAQMKARG